MTSNMLDDNFKIIAYRGGTGIFPENSIEAIQESLKSYSDTIIEIDLQLTKDKVVIAFHDFNLDSLTNGEGQVNDFTVTELKTLFLENRNGTINSVCKIPTLEEIFDNFPNQSFVLDLHENSKLLFDKVIEIVEKKKGEKQIAIVSIAKGATDEFRKLRPSWTFIASPKETKKFILASKLYLHKFVSTNSNIMFLPDKLGGLKILTSTAIKELKRRNIRVWTCSNFKPYENVNNLTDLKRLRELGVDGVYTDNPRNIIDN
jgi:glycerophosphoryl diester phosphodiesterase